MGEGVLGAERRVGSVVDEDDGTMGHHCWL